MFFYLYIGKGMNDPLECLWSVGADVVGAVAVVWVALTAFSWNPPTFLVCLPTVFGPKVSHLQTGRDLFILQKKGTFSVNDHLHILNMNC